MNDSKAPGGKAVGELPPELATDQSIQTEEDEAEDGPSRYSAAEYLERIARLTAMTPSPERNERITKALAQLTRVDPKAALETAAALEGVKLRNDGLESVIHAWGRSDPEAAFAWAKATPNDGTLPESRIDLIFRGLARSGPEKALSFLTAHASELNRWSEQADGVMEEIYQRGGHSQMQSWIAQLSDGRLRDAAMSRFVDQWALYEPHAAKAWMETQHISPANLATMRVELATSWVRVNPQEAIEWVRSLPAKDQGRDLYDAVFRRWIDLDRNGAAGWLAAQPPSPALDRPIERYASQVMEMDPKNSMPWAESITDGERRFRVMSEVADRWGRRDPQGLANYVSSQNLSPQQRDRLLRSAQPKRQ
ncbi:MAG: hypothetical protein ACR2OZ_06915 [Verrucomicrobiales bacterium]